MYLYNKKEYVESINDIKINKICFYGSTATTTYTHTTTIISDPVNDWFPPSPFGTVQPYSLLKPLPKNIVAANYPLNNRNGINIFINDKYKNVLVIINNINGIVHPYNEYYDIAKLLFTYNNIYYFDQREGLYLNKLNTSTGSTTDSVENMSIVYNPNMLSAYNYISSINDLNTKNLFDEYIYYHYINTNAEYGFMKMNGVNNHNNKYALRNISDWEKIYHQQNLNV